MNEKSPGQPTTVPTPPGNLIIKSVGGIGESLKQQTSNLNKYLGGGQPLGKYQGYIYLGLGVGAIALGATRFAPAVAVFLVVILATEITFAVTNSAAIKARNADPVAAIQKELVNG